MVRRWLAMFAPALLLGVVAAGWGVGWLSPLTACLFLLFGSTALMVGVVFPRTQIYAECLVRVPGPRVALTFDDGPHPESTRRVLALLAEHRQHATFFVIGRKVEKYPDVVREIVRAGHAIGVHGYDHDWLHAFKLPGAVAADIRRSQEAVARAAGVFPTLFRPPLGLLSPFTAEGAHQASVSVVGWSLRAFDGVAFRGAADVLRTVERLRSGDVVLLHDAAEAETFTPASAGVLPQIFALMRARGLESIRLPDGAKRHGVDTARPLEVHSGP